MARRPDGNDSRTAGWLRCSPGALADLGQRLRGRRRRRAFLKGAMTAGALAVTGGLTWWLVAPRDQPPGGLTCDQVETLVDAYARGQLDAETRLKVRQHAAQCPRCGPRFKAMGLPV